MSSVKAIPEGLKWVECERGVGGKNSPYDPVQDALAKDKKTTYFKLTLPNTGKELKVAVWASGTPEQFLLHAVETAKIEAELAKQDYVTVRNAEKKKKGNKQEAPGTTTEAASPALVEAKATYDKVLKALEDAASLSQRLERSPSSFMETSSPTRHPWEKIIKAQVTKAPWEDIKGVPHTETPTKTWDSFHECVTFHLLQVFRHDAGEALKYYITNTLKSPTGFRFLNSYLETLPCLYYSPKANQATKKVLPLDDADLATHLLRMCPAKWQTQYDLTENTTPVSTRALLLVLENIENNAELDNKPASTTKAKGADNEAEDGVDGLPHPQKAQEGGLDRKALCAMQETWGAAQKSQYA
eukprot:CCRYP_016438-RA/>CCRYP_016438-RA protein AED:0.40 eAED:0.79 QI:0/0/0/1/1/1/5/0/356